MNIIESYKPIPFEELRWIPRDGFHYNQPAVFIENKFSHYGFPENKTSKYLRSLDILSNDSVLWGNENIKNRAFELIHNYENNCMGSITPLFPFEILLMSNGFIMESFCGLNALDPGIRFIADKIIDDRVYNPRAIVPTRYYTKENKLISMHFGIKTYEYDVKFFFGILDKNNSNINGCYFLSNNVEDFDNAINGKLKYIANNIISNIL